MEEELPSKTKMSMYIKSKSFVRLLYVSLFILGNCLLSVNIAKAQSVTPNASVGCTPEDTYMVVSDLKKEATEVISFSNPSQMYTKTCISGGAAGEGVAVDESRGLVYIADADSAKVDVFSAYSGGRVKTILTPQALDVDLSKDGSILYITGWAGVFAYNTVTGARIYENTKLSFTDGRTWGISVDPITGDLYLPRPWPYSLKNGGGVKQPGVVVIKASSLDSLKTIALGANTDAYAGITHDTDGSFWLIRHTLTDNLIEHYTNSGSLINSCSLGLNGLPPQSQAPIDIAIGPDKAIYIASSDPVACIWRVDPINCQKSVFIKYDPSSSVKGFAFACKDQICVSCSTAVASVTPSACNPDNDQYTVTGTISLTSALAGTAVITDGAFQTTLHIDGNTGNSQASFTLTGLIADGNTHTLTVNLPGCDGSTFTYTAPKTCKCPSTNCYATKATKASP